MQAQRSALSSGRLLCVAGGRQAQGRRTDDTTRGVLGTAWQGYRRGGGDGDDGEDDDEV